ncbi:hypothetical protein P9384_02440 [Bacillus pumilus]|uniref:hypothetical protein n=1 Tax=Bacillus pumilus TaxID=1408 RepID=UPI000D035C33|nr:hypothetical protein [Bacillus pumilus]MCY7500675.1 hypothetical protein [Bacillus pumilus]MCY7526539.1 hypothetical protein [Bacillus pumilus]MED4439062.1 hypothetical protein [Bacillus pumilus]MED4491455.1 hypothetical protein [Bacillus pumilus]MED4628003.1 hypothetical protein [Bacillus pumilus]
MATLNIYTLSTARQLDLFLTQNGELDLDYVLQLMRRKAAPINEDGAITGEGFIQPEIRERDSSRLIESYCTSRGSLGYYNEARMQGEALITRRTQHQFYSKTAMLITEKSDLVLTFYYTSEEGSKSNIKSLIETLGFEATIFRIDHSLMEKVQKKFAWSAVKLDKIDKGGDKTKRVSYEIDLADDQSTSQVDEDYRDFGKRSHITFELPYNSPGAPSKISVKMYSQGNRIVINENELGNSSLEDFVLYLLNALKEIKEEEV